MKKYLKILLVVGILLLSTGIAKAEVRLDVLKTTYFQSQNGNTVISPGTIRMQETLETAGSIRKGDQIFITLPAGVTFLKAPNTGNIDQFVTIPNSISGSNRISGINLLSGSEKTFSIEITGINDNGSRAVLEFTFNNADSSLIVTKEGPIVVDFFSTTIPFASSEVEEFPVLTGELHSYVGEPQEIVEIPLIVKNNSSLREGKFKIGYDSSIIKLEKIIKGDLIGKVKLQDDIINFSLSPARKGDIEICKLIFQVIGSDNQQSEITISRDEIYNNKNQKYLVTVANGLVKVKEEEREKKHTILRIGDNSAKINNDTVLLESLPILLNNKTMVPLRFISESLGGEVNWDQITSSIEININGKQLVLNISGDVNSDQFQVIDGVTYVPLRYISEYFGAEVIWNPISQAINIFL